METVLVLETSACDSEDGASDIMDELQQPVEVENEDEESEGGRDEPNGQLEARHTWQPSPPTLTAAGSSRLFSASKELPLRLQGSWHKELKEIILRLHKLQAKKNTTVIDAPLLCNIAAATAAWARDPNAPPQLLLPLKRAANPSWCTKSSPPPLSFSSLAGPDLAVAEALRRAFLRGQPPALEVFLVRITQTQTVRGTSCEAGHDCLRVVFAVPPSARAATRPRSRTGFLCSAASDLLMRARCAAL